ncbi:unnamed protein product, partial [marine sediment metagenome]
GVIEEEEKEMIRNIFEFGDTIIAFLSLLLAKYLRCNLLVDITAISTPEKKEAINIHINNIKGLTSIHHSVKISLPPMHLYPEYYFQSAVVLLLSLFF